MPRRGVLRRGVTAATILVAGTALAVVATVCWLTVVVALAWEEVTG